MSDDETWVDADHANTLNAFDVGDTRTTHAVIAETFSVYPEGGNGADIAAAKVERSPSLTKVKSERGIHIVNALDRQAGGPDDNSAQAGHLIPFDTNFSNQASPGGSTSPTLDTRGTHGVAEGMTVRRLTPVECERLMGWPDGWTAPEGVKASDSKRYAACGDGIVAPVAFWIADRIRMIEEEEAS